MGRPATHAYVMSVPCGCVAAMCVDKPDYAKDIQDYRDEGYTVTRLPIGTESWVKCEKHESVGHNEWVGAIEDQLEAARAASKE